MPKNYRTDSCKILPLFLGLPLATKFKLIQIFYSSEKRGLWLCLMTCSSEMLQNLPYFWNKKNHLGNIFLVFHFMLLVLYFSPLICPSLWVFLFQKYDKF